TIDLFGSRGSLHVPVLNQGHLLVRTAAGERSEFHPPHPNIHQPLIEDFVAALHDDRPPLTDGHLGREIARIEDPFYGR
ncbi:MAG: hypothetical protein EBZ36_15030, partial [Acidobacteria bacterium]|nr:hypothetical protein [Acidobacteriota bacterium]